MRMFPLSPYKKQALVVGAVVLGLALLPAIASAQLPNFGTVQTEVRKSVSPLIDLVRIILALVAVLGGMFEAFKATKGDAKAWIPALLLWIVAGIVIAPGTVLDMLGMNQLKNALNDWGLGF